MKLEKTETGYSITDITEDELLYVHDAVIYTGRGVAVSSFDVKTIKAYVDILEELMKEVVKLPSRKPEKKIKQLALFDDDHKDPSWN